MINFHSPVFTVHKEKAYFCLFKDSERITTTATKRSGNALEARLDVFNAQKNDSGEYRCVVETLAPKYSYKTINIRVYGE